MQPHVIKKNRILSPIGLMVFALMGSTMFIAANKYIYTPWSNRRRHQKTSQFADEYFEKHKKSNIPTEDQ